MATLPSMTDVNAAMNIVPYDSAPWNINSSGFRSFLEGWTSPSGLHNAAHMWVGGSMMPATSPNDPVFFLHHANVDRIWANWQRKWLNSGSGDYLPVSGGPPGHNLTDGMLPWGTPFTPQTVLDTFALGYWYDDAAAPAITGLTPASGDGAGGTIVVIVGADFTGTTAINFGANSAVTFNVDSDTQITALSPAGTGSVNVTIVTPIGISGISASTQFTYAAAAPPPQVTGISPTSGSTAGGDTVVLTGAGFTDTISVDFGPAKAPSFSVDSDTQITVTSPAGSAGTVDITVTTAAGKSSASAADQFTFILTPVITGLNPTTGSPTGGDTVVIAGTTFTGATGVGFGTKPATSFTVDSDTQITAISPPGTGTVDVTVTTPAGTSATSAADQFTFAVPGAPVVTSLTPSSGAAAGGDTVTIAGNGFAGATAVAFGPRPAASFTVDSSTQITAKSPSGTGTVDVTVTTPLGTSAVVGADQFTYAPPVAPVVIGLSPAMGAPSGGDTVTITGTGFTGATMVMFGTAMATTVSVDSDTEITATSPAGTGTVDVTVTTPGGTSATGPADQFTYAVSTAPVISSLNPTSGAGAGGDTVVITGTGFTGTTAVSFGANAATFSVDSDTQITATTPGGSGTVDVTVTTPAGTSATGPADQFTYVGLGLPAVTGVSPGTGSSSGGDQVVVTGIGFTGATDVSFGPNSASFFSVDMDTQITVTTPPGTGTVDVTVTTAVGTSPTVLSDQFTYV
jgi:hypothetical protein